MTNVIFGEMQGEIHLTEFAQSQWKIHPNQKADSAWPSGPRDFTGFYTTGRTTKPQLSAPLQVNKQFLSILSVDFIHLFFQ